MATRKGKTRRRTGKSGNKAVVVETAAPEAEATETVKRSQAEQLRLYKARYETYQAPSGNLSMDNGDEVALLLRGASVEAIMAAAEKLKGLEPGTLAKRYADRNTGAKRMNSGNQIRALVRRGDKTIKDVKAALRG